MNIVSISNFEVNKICQRHRMIGFTNIINGTGLGRLLNTVSHTYWLNNVGQVIV